VGGIKLEGARVKEVTRVIEHHDHHDNAAQQVDRIDSTPGLIAGDWLSFQSVQNLVSKE
jgi:hypothetical protein